MSGVTSTSDQSTLETAQDAGSAVASAAKEFGIAAFAAVWTVVWIALAYQTMQAEGLLDAVIVGVYTLAPVGVVVLWRLGERTSFAAPTLDDLVGPDGTTDDANETANDEVVDRYAYGED